MLYSSYLFKIARVQWQKVRCIPLTKTLLTSVLIAEIQQKKQKRISFLLVFWDLAIHAHSVVPCLKLDSREKMKSTDTPLHRCGICAKAFPYSSQLLFHSFEHSNEWPYRYPVCQQSFAVRSRLERHKKQRNIVRKIHCSKCF
ncbi:hypothetical protein TNIN_170521 [Trichonephila inaurata madagascariensis]|uniref:C2H2-type domain-containing protein n=1 Tax=Trichonephila inaurata madagascariensis TaxID=2747483 RepID=A0A8X6JXV2_9ARAC|nr:hypothetical protein TNIN_170521 [Trichonephila inaurata madagascariensis]